jgi:uncharacterized phage protein gp47/JayE
LYEHQTYEAILKRMLDRVPGTVDKREGSIIYDALAPAAAELAQSYVEMDLILRQSFADTASGKFLTWRAAESGVFRKQANNALRRGLFYASNETPLDVPIGSRFRIDDVTFRVEERLAAGIFALWCEVAGTVGNSPVGSLLPIDYAPGLVRAEVTDILEPGAEQEDDEALRRRYMDQLQGQAFGGNIADYRQKVLSMDGVTAVKPYPVWNGPGTVRIVILGVGHLPAEEGVVNRVQDDIDPYPQGEGIGIAPIGHVVTVESALGITINVETTLALDTGFDPQSVLPGVTAQINQYFDELRQAWQAQTQITVRTALIDSRVLNVAGVLDVTNTMLNGTAANITLVSDQVPVLGTVTIHE